MQISSVDFEIMQKQQEGSNIRSQIVENPQELQVNGIRAVSIGIWCKCQLLLMPFIVCRKHLKRRKLHYLKKKI